MHKPNMYSAGTLRQMSEYYAVNAPHLVPIFDAVRFGHIRFLMIEQGAIKIDGELGRLKNCSVILIGDDEGVALGPNQFDQIELANLIKSAHAVAIIASEPILEVYSAMSDLATAGNVSLIIETLPSHELAWTTAVRTACPETPIILCRAKETKK